MTSSLGFDLFLSLPLVVLVLGALLLLLLESISPARKSGSGDSPHVTSLDGNVVDGVRGHERAGWITAAVIFVSAICAAATGGLASPGQTAFGGFIYVDPFTQFMVVVLLFGSLLAVLLGLGLLGAQGISARSEYYSLLLFATAGAVMFVSSAELVTLFVSLEIMSLALYALCGAALALRRSAESALKYFLLGSFSSAFLLYGIALLYGVTGSTFIADVSRSLAAGVPSESWPVLMFALGLMLVGLVFKIGAVPFHFWAPDVYEGAPTSVTAYMACVIKAAACAATLRVLWVAFDSVHEFWAGAVWTMAVLTMCIGNLVALRQRGLKRMLAYSSIAHAGYMMVAFLAPGSTNGGGAAILYYLLAYTLMTMGAFAVVLAVTSERDSEREHDDISRFYELSERSPLLAVLMALFMLSLAGIPPGLAGLLGKFYIFGAAIKADYVGLVIIGVLNSAVSCYYYLRVIVAMYFIKAESVEGLQQFPAIRPLTPALLGVLGVCSVGVVLFGVFPGLLHDSAAVVMMGFGRAR